MIAKPDSTSETMVRSLSQTIAVLGAASEIDADLTPEDRSALAAEKNLLVPVLDKLLSSRQTLESFLLKQSVRLQARVIIGDAMLDRGVRRAKTRMKLDVGMNDVDFVFGSNLEDIIDAGIRNEPILVRECAARLSQIPDFAGKDELKKEMEQRAESQLKALTERDAGDSERKMLASAVVKAISDGSDALYRLEKRLLDRFPRERAYVRGFFFDVSPKRKPKKPEAAAVK